MCQVRDKIIFAMRLVTQGLSNLALAIAHPIECALASRKSPSMLSHVSG